jgi:quercetin dioxygenase-like cupin family protein
VTASGCQGAEANGNLFKVAKGVGSTRWHSHDDQDEVFLIIGPSVTSNAAGGKPAWSNALEANQP